MGFLILVKVFNVFKWSRKQHQRKGCRQEALKSQSWTHFLASVRQNIWRNISDIPDRAAVTDKFINLCNVVLSHNQNSSVSSVAKQRAARPAGQNVSARINVHTGFGTHRASYPIGTGFFTWRWNGLNVKLTTHILLPRLRTRGSFSPLPHTSTWCGA
jgi:hypothetical protein